MSLETLIATAIGALVTFIAAHFYYAKAGAELRAEAKRLREVTDLVLYKLQHPEAKTEIRRDANGHVVGLFVHMDTRLNSKSDSA